MAKQKLLLDTNIIVDFLNRREPWFEDARLLMICGRVGEFSLWISSSQVTDLVYIVSQGGRKDLVPQTLERLRYLRTFVNVVPVSDADVDRILATSWSDPEDALLVDLALKIRADAVISRDAVLRETDLLPVYDCGEFFDMLRRDYGVDYDEILQ
ncbi:type II toxin-antitoxin system VapC family toxin [Slackia heliotrinireducens]|uniref:type II toxin-antitoxin system VapC family toxin n=1 Tax=Slackia heliotrinireducens TaxID=84110 RepID=UPI003315B209